MGVDQMLHRLNVYYELKRYTPDHISDVGQITRQGHIRNSHLADNYVHSKHTVQPNAFG